MNWKNDMKKIMMTMSVALLLSSCGLYNKYERPEVQADGIVRDPVLLTDTLAVSDTTSFGNCKHSSNKALITIQIC